jgi:hypothetical protein
VPRGLVARIREQRERRAQEDRERLEREDPTRQVLVKEKGARNKASIPRGLATSAKRYLRPITQIDLENLVDGEFAKSRVEG